MNPAGTPRPNEAHPPRTSAPGRIETSELSVSYGKHRALESVCLTIPRHQITAIVGPSGCGKSTFLSTLNRLTDMVANCRVQGTVCLAGENILAADYDVLQLRRRVGMVFQKPNPLPLSIRRNLTLPLREHRFPKDQITSIVEAALREVGLWNEVKDRLDTSAQSLSGGQQQRLCIARAIALNPDVLLFDEPCSALDPLASGVIEDLIESLRHRVTVVIVTHNLPQARRLADQLAVFQFRGGAGALLESGPAARVFDAPTHALTAEYLREGRLPKLAPALSEKSTELNDI